MQFKRATKQQSKLRLALVGPSGSGKTFTALTLAKTLGKRVAVVDTERGSASKYSGDVADFDVLELDSFAPRTYREAISAAEAAGYDVLVLDSLSHAWIGKDGSLEQVDRAKARNRGGNDFSAWRDVTPEHNALVEAILGARMHVIATMRAKTEWIMEERQRGGRTITVPRKVGLAPVQRNGVEYEFDVVGDMDDENRLAVSKTRCPALSGAVMLKPGAELAQTLLAWLSDGAQPEAPATPEPEPDTKQGPKPQPEPDTSAPTAPPLDTAETDPEPAPESTFDFWAGRIGAARNQADLDNIAADIASAVQQRIVGGPLRDKLRGTWVAASEALRAAQNGEQNGGVS
jgi:hypothetical protein